MRKTCDLKRVGVMLLALVLCLSALMPMSCSETPAETTPAETTKTPTPESSPESTPESTPEVTTPESTPVETTPAPSVEFNISYDLDGGIVEGNPLVYDNAFDTKIAIPVKVGYDFVGWTGTGIDTPTVSLTIAKGTEGDIALKANWEENGEFEFKLTEDTEDLFGKIFFGNTNAAFVINDEDTFENRNNLDGIKNENDKVIKEKMPSINPSNELMLRKLRDYFTAKEQSVEVVRDSELADNNDYDFLFYFGISDCAPAEEFVSTLNYAQYGIAVNADSLCFIAWTEAANEENGAILYEIIDHVVKGGSFSDFVGGRYVGTVEGTVGADVPALEGLDGGTDVGEGAYQIFSLDSTKEIYDAYLTKLEAAGYTLYTTNVMNQTHCATFYNDDTVVNVMFAGGDAEGTLGVDADRSLRVVIDPLAITALPSLEKPADANATVTVSSVTQLYPTNLCIIFQLSNGHFIILDSGNNGDTKAIVNFLRSKAPDPNNVVIEAWIFSHFHQDHIGGFVDAFTTTSMRSYARYLDIKSIIYNFPSTRNYMTAYKSGTDMSNMANFYDKIVPQFREKGITFYQARTGQKYYFGNAEIEILWTFEDITPLNIYTDSTNRTDIGFRVTIEGQTFMLVGDSTEEQFRLASARYGDYLKSDFVQLAHHGSGNGLGSHDFYTIVDAPVVFHPRKQGVNESGYAIGGNEKKALQAADLIIRSGNYKTATLNLPFTIGDAIVSDRTPEDESHTFAPAE